MYSFVAGNLQEMRIQKLRKTIYNAGVHFAETLPRSFRPWLFTLTYAEVDAWKPNHIRDYLKRVRSFLHRRGISLRCAWVAELQQRGAVHYHIILWLPRSIRLPKSDTQGWWSFGYTNQQIAKKGVGYLMKYVSKMDSKHKFPHRCRIFGVSGLDKEGKQRVRYYKAPKYIRDMLGGKDYKSCDLRKIKGAYNDRITGISYPTRYRLCFLSSGTAVFTDYPQFDISFHFNSFWDKLCSVLLRFPNCRVDLSKLRHFELLTKIDESNLVF